MSPLHCRLCRPRRPNTCAKSPLLRRRRGEILQDTDSPLEGNGFEILVPRCLATANSVGAFISASGCSVSRRNSSIGLARPTTARVIPPRRLSIGPNRRPKPQNRCLSGAELKFRIHFPPPESPLQTRSGDCWKRPAGPPTASRGRSTRQPIMDAIEQIRFRDLRRHASKTMEGGFADEIAAAPGVLLKIEWAEPSCWLL